jgi:hypothetical protein
MRKGFVLFITLFVLGVGVLAQSNRVGIFAAPQYCFFKQRTTTPATKGNGIILNGSVYYERKWDMSGFSVSLGYTQMNTALLETKNKKGFVSVAFDGFYEGEVADRFFIGPHVMIGTSYLISEKMSIGGVDSTVAAGGKLYYLLNVGVSFSYMFSENIGLSAIPMLSLTSVLDPKTPFYFGVGGQIRFFYDFGD